MIDDWINSATIAFLDSRPDFFSYIHRLLFAYFLPVVKWISLLFVGVIGVSCLSNVSQLSSSSLNPAQLLINQKLLLQTSTSLAMPNFAYLKAKSCRPFQWNGKCLALVFDFSSHGQQIKILERILEWWRGMKMECISIGVQRPAVGRGGANRPLALATKRMEEKIFSLSHENCCFFVSRCSPFIQMNVWLVTVLLPIC